MIRFQCSMWTLPGSWLKVLLLLAVFAVGGGPGAAVGQDADVQALLDRGREAGADIEQMRTVVERARRAGLDAETTASLLRPAVTLAEQDLPTGPLLSKTLEGMAKQVPPARVQPVLQQYRTHTEQAGQLVTQWAQRSEVRQLLGDAEDASGADGQAKAHTRLITTIAEAQQQDLPIKNIEGFLDDLPANVERRPVAPAEVAAAVSVLPDLPGNGASPEPAQQLLTSALDAGYSPESLRQLPSALQRAHQKSKRPVDVLANGAAQAIARGTPAAQVLQSLFQGGLPGGGPPAGTGPPGNTPGTGKPPDTGPPDDAGPSDGPPGGGGSGSGGPGGSL